MAQYVCSSLVSSASSVGVAIFGDSTDIYSPSLSASFQGELQKCLGSRGSYDPEPYQRGNTRLIQQGVTDAIQKKHDQFMFFAGYISDLDTLEAQVQSLQIGSSSRVTILGGDGLYDITDPSHNFFAPIYMTIYASPLNMQDAQSKALFNEYEKQFPLPYLYSAIQSYGPYYLLPQDVIRTYEATEAFIQTLQTFVRDNQNTSLPSQDKFDQTLSNISFPAFTNLITFQGDVTNDPLPLLYSLLRGWIHRTGF